MASSSGTSSSDVSIGSTSSSLLLLYKPQLNLWFAKKIRILWNFVTSFHRTAIAGGKKVVLRSYDLVYRGPQNRREPGIVSVDLWLEQQIRAAEQISQVVLEKKGTMKPGSL